MGYDDRREVLQRLEELERLVRHEDRGPWGGRGRGRRHHHHHHHGDHDHCHGGDHCHDHDRDHGGGDFDEKRVIDTIVRLVSEQVGRIVEERQQSERGPGEDGGEKRIVDLIVRCVSEHVQEIVATELDRRFGRADAGPVGPPAPAGPPEPERP